MGENMKHTKYIDRYVHISFLVLGIVCAVILCERCSFFTLDKISNYWHSKDNITWSMETESQSTYKEIKKQMTGEEILSKELDEYIRAIYFKSNKIKIPMVEGRFFRPEDFKQNNHYVVLGKNFLDILIKEQNNQYLEYGGIRFEVIGIIGMEKSSLLDKMIFFNLEDVEPLLRGNGGVWILDNIKSKNKLLEIFKNQDGQINLIERKSWGSDRLYDLNMYKLILYGVLFCVYLSFIGMLLFYTLRFQNYIYISLLLGFSLRRIYSRVCLNVVNDVSLYFLIGLVAGTIILYKPWYQFGEIKNTFVIFIFLSLLIITVVSIKVFSEDIGQKLRRF